MPFVGGPNTFITNPRWRTAAILEKSKNRRISATIWPIDSKFGSVTHFSCIDPSHPWNEIPIFWKSKMAAAAILKNWKNGHILATDWPIAAKFGNMTHFDSLNLSHPWNSHLLKIQDSGDGHLKKSKNRHISATVWPTDSKFGSVTHLTVLSFATSKVSRFRNSKMAAAILKTEKSPYLSNGLTDRRKI